LKSRVFPAGFFPGGSFLRVETSSRIVTQFLSPLSFSLARSAVVFLPGALSIAEQAHSAARISLPLSRPIPSRFQAETRCLPQAFPPFLPHSLATPPPGFFPPSTETGTPSLATFLTHAGPLFPPATVSELGSPFVARNFPFFFF